MKQILIVTVLLMGFVGFSQDDNSEQDYKKRVLETAEISILSSLYGQNGAHAAVTGGIGDEDLKNVATDINIAIPINADDVLTIDATVSAYSSASSSNLNPITGASKGGGGEGEGDDDRSVQDQNGGSKAVGSPWTTSNNKSRRDVWLNGNFGYSHTSDDRTNIYSGGISVANEFDYFSLGGHISYVKSFNEENTTLNFGSKIYLDHWRPTYPGEFKDFVHNFNGTLDDNYFSGIDIYNQNGQIVNKNSSQNWRLSNPTIIKDKGRNTYTFTLSFSQVLSKRMQVSFISEMTYQKGWLANPLQRVYFADKPNFYIGNPSGISNYTNRNNTGTFQLADDIERLPHARIKIPLAMRFHYYINEFLVMKTYYRYYFDDWGIQSHTFEVELPVKLNFKWTLYPSYRFYNQTGAKYFAPYERHLSTEQFYTSDYDLSPFSANQFGMGIKYRDATTSKKLFGLVGLKNITLNFNHYNRSDGFNANIISIGTKLLLN